MKEREGKRVTEKEGVIFVLFQNNKVLLENRTAPGKTYYGYIIVPGGKVEKEDDHDFECAAKREVLEECGVKTKSIHLLDRFLNVTGSNHMYDTVACLVTEFDGDVINNENKSEHIWASLDEAFNLVSFADSRYVLMLAKEKLISEGLIEG